MVESAYKHKVTSSIEPYLFFNAQAEIHPKLSDVVLKHARNNYERPITDKQRRIFDSVETILQNNSPLILDSGCGTGLSTVRLASLFPDHFVLGIDRSFARLQKFKALQTTEKVDNCAVLQANLEDFWRLLAASSIPVKKHYLLYPNPYPKVGDLGKRWHGHPVFPVLAELSPHLNLRSNWKVYVEEFAAALRLLHGTCVQVSSCTPTEPLSAFEKKYLAAQSPLYSLEFNDPRNTSY